MVSGMLSGMQMLSGAGAVVDFAKNLQQQARAQQQAAQQAQNLNGMFKSVYGLQAASAITKDRLSNQAGAMPPISYGTGMIDALNTKNWKKPEGKTMLGHLRDYLGKNRDIIFNVALIVLVDHFVFNGAFREKIKNLLDQFLVKTHKMISVDEATVGKTSESV